MTTVTEGDLKRLEDLITALSQRMESRFDAVESRLERVETRVQDLTIAVAVLDSKVEGIDKRVDDTNKRINDAIKSIDDTNTRLNTITFGIFSVVGVFATGILGIMAKIVFFPNP